ncbi:hypothetical protein QBC46DRAFT_347178 [Diplogelasinospora grovesii]|uniref:Uncharacterized protein n=1 Tax=Diplogelasinospora grovesii TaxID=303347 RepID=A0AAN6MXH7_9PEZI|nr:hypothetical protein QBC46DRAFT_347178 [Diplogelasinospora grovesii]
MSSGSCSFLSSAIATLVDGFQSATNPCVFFVGLVLRARDLVVSDPSISSNYNWVQTITAIFQLGNGAVTQYRPRGDQIERYGYATFGLTVIPYLVMTVVNLLAQIASTDYPNVYMVGSPEMEEARGRGGVFDGVVGNLEPDHSDRENGAERPVYRFNAVDGEGQSGRVLFMERVSGSSVYPAVVRLTGEKRSEDDGITVAAYTPYQLHTHPRTRFRVWAFQFFDHGRNYGLLEAVRKAADADLVLLQVAYPGLSPSGERNVE